MFPFNPAGQMIKTDAGVLCARAFMAHFKIAALLATVASSIGVHVGIACSATLVVVTDTGIDNPGVPRNITATTGGNTADIKAVQVTVTGTNSTDEIITEVLPVFTVDTPGMVTGDKAFKTVTSISIPAMDGAGATVAIGFGEKLGLPFKLPYNTVDKTYFDNVIEATAPTVTVSATDLEDNTIVLNTALNSKVIDVYLIV